MTWLMPMIMKTVMMPRPTSASLLRLRRRQVSAHRPSGLVVGTSLSTVGGSGESSCGSANEAAEVVSAMGRYSYLMRGSTIRVGDVDHQVGDHVHEGGEEHAAGHHRQVARVDGVVDHQADAEAREDGLGEDGAAHEGAQVDAGDRHHWDQRVLEAVPEHDGALGQALGPRRAHVVGADHLEHRGALHVRDVGDLDHAERRRRAG